MWNEVKITPGAHHKEHLARLLQGRPSSALSSKGPASVCNSTVQTQSFLGGLRATLQLLSAIKPRRGPNPLVT